MLNPGDTGYVCEMVYNGLIDTSFAPEEIDDVQPHGTIEVHDPREALDVEIIGSTLKETMSYPNLICQVVNNGTEALSLLTVACPVFVADGTLLSVISSINTSPLAPGATYSVDQMALI